MASFDFGSVGNILGGAGQFIGAIGGIAAEKKNYQLQKSQLDWQKGQWEEVKQREDTAIQRRMEDLTAAGMNPILAAGGSGASTQQAPVLSAPQRNAEQIQRSLASLIPVQAMQEIARTKAETNRINAQTDLIKNQAGEVESKIDLNKLDLEINQLQLDMTNRDYKIIKGEEVGMRSDVRSGHLLDIVNSFNYATEAGINLGNMIYELLFGRKVDPNKYDDVVVQENLETLGKTLKSLDQEGVIWNKDASAKDIAIAWTDYLSKNMYHTEREYDLSNNHVKEAFDDLIRNNKYIQAFKSFLTNKGLIISPGTSAW